MSLKDILWGSSKEVQSAAKTTKLEYLATRKKLTPHEETEFLQSKKDRKSIRVKRSLTLTFSAAMLTGIGFAVAALLDRPTTQSPDWFKVQDSNLIGRNRVSQAIQAAQDWDDIYHCGRDVTLRYLAVTQAKTPKGATVDYDEVAEPGAIFIAAKGDTRNIILHAMTHACKPDQPTLLAQPLKYLKGSSEVYGYHGLTLLVRDGDMGETKFTMIEEGMAERNAARFQKYTSPTLGYGNVGRDTLAVFSHQTTNAHRLVQNNDVPGFTRKFLNLPPDTPITGEHLEDIMFRYAQSYNPR